MSLKNNKAVQMLDAAAQSGYGVLGVVTYNMETVVAALQAAEAKKSPIQILLFPWAYHYSPLFVKLVARACREASIPAALHMDHAQDPDVIRQVAAMDIDGTPVFDSIMVDMSHFEKEENLSKTRELVQLCRSRGIATEAEPGRIEGGEDGVKDTAELEGMMTTPEEVEEFIATGIDFLAPAFGNVHGEYGGEENIKLDYGRLEGIREKCKGRVQVVLHGTNGFPEGIMKKCISGGVTRINVNKLVMDDYLEYVKGVDGPLTKTVEEGTGLIRKRIEEWMDIIESSGKA